MNKQQAINLMREGKKITHYYFGKEEWMTMKDGMILLEDGVVCSENEFWIFRCTSGWNEGYSIYDDKNEHGINLF